MDGRRVFLAGATGAIGSVLSRLLINAGYSVYGGSRRAQRAGALESSGVVPIIVDVFDAQKLTVELIRIAPSCVIHQLTDLPANLDPQLMSEAIVRNARIRTEGTRNLVAAALAAGVRRLVAQSIAWAYAPGPIPCIETDGLDHDATGGRRITVAGVVALEQAVLQSPPLIGTVLRYGQLYGPGTSNSQPTGASPVHVDAAAWAALLSVQHSTSGIYNIVEDNPQISNAKAKREIGWTPDWRRSAT